MLSPPACSTVPSARGLCAHFAARPAQISNTNSKVSELSAKSNATRNKGSEEPSFRVRQGFVILQYLPRMKSASLVQIPGGEDEHLLEGATDHHESSHCSALCHNPPPRQGQVKATTGIIFLGNASLVSAIAGLILMCKP